MLSGEYDIIVLDEINVSVWFGLLNVPEVMRLLDQRPGSIELVLTGRHAPQAFLDRADLITEAKSIRHYFDKGVPARKGIEM